MNSEQLITEHLDLWTSTVKVKSTQGRGSNSKRELYGIKKLRELILELAVRGKLVEQNPDDVPASEALKRITESKARLLKDKKVKKQKLLPELTDKEKPFELPIGWLWTQLGQITEIAPRNDLADDLEVGFVPMPLITTSYKGDHDQEYKTWGEIKKGYTHFQDGDIGLAKITPCFENSKAAVFRDLKNGYGAGTTELHIARPLPGTVEPLFVLLYLKAPMFLEKGKPRMTGSAGQKRIPYDFFAGNPFPFPPVAEQHRIVAKVDELMALCDQLEQQTESSLAVHNLLVDTLLSTLTDANDADELSDNWARLADHFDTLITTDYAIEQLKQTILQLAVQGKLVPQDPDDEPASNLLAQLRTDNLTASRNIETQDRYTLLNSFDLPSGWEACRLSDLTPHFQNGLSSRGDNQGNEVVVLRLADIHRGQISMEETRVLQIKEESIKRYDIKKGDILIVRVNGSADLVGRFISCHEDYQAIYCDHFIRMRFPHECFSLGYLSLLGSSPLIRERIADLFVSTAGQKTVNQSHINSLIVTLPPLAEQHRIVRRVEEFNDLIEQLGKRLISLETTRFQLANTLVEGNAKGEATYE